MVSDELNSVLNSLGPYCQTLCEQVSDMKVWCYASMENYDQYQPSRL